MSDELIQNGYDENDRLVQEEMDREIEQADTFDVIPTDDSVEDEVEDLEETPLDDEGNIIEPTDVPPDDPDEEELEEATDVDDSESIGEIEEVDDYDVIPTDDSVEDEIEDWEETDESLASEEYTPEVLNDNIVTLPTICSVKEGDQVVVAIVEGEPTVIGSVGFGDRVEADIAANQEAVETAQTAANSAQSAADEAKTLANTASTAAGEAKTLAEDASTKADAAEAAVEPIKTDIDTLKKDRDSFTESLETLENTMKADYAKNSDLASLETNLQTQISQNAGEISSVASSVDTIRADSNEAKEMAQNASNSVAAAQEKADSAEAKAKEASDAAAAAQAKADEADANLATAQQALTELQGRTTATEEDIQAAQQAVDAAQQAADAANSAANQAKTDAANAQSAADKAQADVDAAKTDIANLTTRVTTAETKISQNSDAITLNATKVEEVESNLADNYYTKTETDAQIKVSSDAITSTVSSTYTTKTEFNNLEIGGRNYIRYGRGNVKDGFFSYFDSVGDDYGEHAFASQATYERIDIASGFVLGGRDYEVGKEIVFSYDIMYTTWDFPEGTDRKEFWIGQRYESQKNSGGDTTGQWRSINSHSLPRVGQNGCELNEWYRVEYKTIIPEQAADGIVVGSYIQFYNSNADVAASVAFRMKNVKLEYGNKATDWTPAPEDMATNDDVSQTNNAVSELSDALDVTKDDLATLEEAQSNFVTTETFTTTTSSLEQTAGSIEAKFSTQISELQNGLEKEVEERTALITASYDVDDNVVGLKLGVSTNELSAEFTNEALTFNRNKIPVVTLSAEKEMLDIRSVEIEKELQLGGFQWRSRDNGNMGLVWIGGDE